MMSVVAQDVSVSLPQSPPREESAPVAGTVKSVARAFRALEFVAARRDGASAKEIAAHLDIALPSTYHLLATLVESGYLVHLANNARFGIGYQVRVLERGLTNQLEVPKAIRDAIAHLHVQADAAAYYAVYRETDVVLAHVVDSAQRPRVQALDVGFHEASHATAFGKVMLAAMDAEQRRDYLRRFSLLACTTRTITDLRTLERHLDHVRESGIALEIGEFQDGIACMAAPVRTPAGEVVATVAISIPLGLFAKRRWDLERAVRHGALVANRALSVG